MIFLGEGGALIALIFSSEGWRPGDHIGVSQWTKMAGAELTPNGNLLN